jgi:hypothetical protein
MKREGKHFIIHGLFVDDMMHIATNNKLKDEVMEKYSSNFNITGGGLMKTFLGMEIEQSNRSIKLHLDHYIREMLIEYKAYIKKSLQSKRVPFLPGVILRPEDNPTLPDPSNRSSTGPCCQASVCSFMDSLRYLVFFLQYRRWLDSVLRQAQPIGQHFIISWSTSRASQASRSQINCRIKHSQDLLCGYADSD